MWLWVCARWGGTSTYNNCNLAISSLTNDGKERGRVAGNKGHHGGKNTSDYQFGGCCFSSSPHPPLWHSLSNIHFRSAISNVTGPPLAQGYRTKVYLPFMSSTFSPGSLMNITDWFTEKLKMLAAGIHSPLWFPGRTTNLKESIFFYRPFTFWSVHPLIAHVTGNRMSLLNCVTPSLCECVSIRLHLPCGTDLMFFLV